MTTVTKTAAFKWNDENSEVIRAAYVATVDKDGIEVANTTVYLTELAEQVGAASARSVRQKLAQMKVYIKGEGKTSTSGPTSRMKKVILASLIADEIEKQDDTVGDAKEEIFASLEHAGRPALIALLAFLQGRPIGNEDLES